jgi:hypothetical protein
LDETTQLFVFLNLKNGCFGASTPYGDEAMQVQRIDPAAPDLLLSNVTDG